MKKPENSEQIAHIERQAKKKTVGERSLTLGRHARMAGAALAIMTLGMGVVGVTGTLGQPESLAQHGEARMFFPPWISEAEAVFRIHRAGGVPISDPGEEAGRNGMFRAIAARADFAARIREEGAFFVLF